MLGLANEHASMNSKKKIKKNILKTQINDLPANQTSFWETTLFVFFFCPHQNVLERQSKLNKDIYIN